MSLYESRFITDLYILSLSSTSVTDTGIEERVWKFLAHVTQGDFFASFAFF